LDALNTPALCFKSEAGGMTASKLTVYSALKVTSNKFSSFLHPVDARMIIRTRLTRDLIFFMPLIRVCFGCEVKIISFENIILCCILTKEFRQEGLQI
jgi:hypothetical protein